MFEVLGSSLLTTVAQLTWLAYHHANAWYDAMSTLSVVSAHLALATVPSVFAGVLPFAAAAFVVLDGALAFGTFLALPLTCFANGTGVLFGIGLPFLGVAAFCGVGLVAARLLAGLDFAGED